MAPGLVGRMPTSTRRGQPLLMLVLVLFSWVALRAVVWEPPYANAAQPVAAAGRVPVQGKQAPMMAVLRGVNRAGSANDAAKAAGGARPASAVIWPMTPAATLPLTERVSAPVIAGPFLQAPSAPATPLLLTPARVPHLAAGHQLLLMAGLGYIELPEAVRPALARPAVLDRGSQTSAPRWSGDGWLLLRGGASPAALAAGSAGYGGSQAGAVVRYNLAPRSRMRPAAYLRVSGALDVPGGQQEAALGLSLRPLAALPVTVLAEGRVQRSIGVTRLRPAVALVSALPPQRLPLGLEGEAYAQGGYVGGRGATPFFDAQLTADRPVLDVLPGKPLRLGGGAWAGGQKGAARLDIGPRAAVRLDIAGTPSRLTLDWRFRVMGKAEPGSGPALTLSAGF